MSAVGVATRAHRRADAALCFVEAASASLAGAAFALAMVLVSLDAFMRHLFAEPLTFQLFFTQSYLMVVGMLLGFSWGYRTGGAVQVEILVGRLPHRLAGGLVRVLLFVAALYMAMFAYNGWGRFYETFVAGEVKLGVVDWPLDWSWIWIPLGCGIFALRLLLDSTAPRLRVIGRKAETAS